MPRLAATASTLMLATLLAAPALAQEAAQDTAIVVTAQRANQSQVTREGNLGALGDQPAENVPFSIKSYNAALILNQQPQTLGQVLENDPSVRTTYGFGNAAEQFVVRGFTLYGDDVGYDGLYGITPRQLVAPELYESVQVLNGASAFLNGAAPGGSGVGGNVNLVAKRAGPAALFRATLGYTSGSHLGGSIDAARRFGGGAIGVRINGVYRAGDVSVDDEFRRTTAIGAAIDYRGADVRLSLDLAYQRVQVRHLRPKVTIATATVPEAPDGSHNYGQAFSYTTLRDVFGSVRGEWDLADDLLVHAAFGARDGSEDGIYDGITVTDAATGAASGNALYVPRTDNNEAAELGLRAKVSTGPISHAINLGGSKIRQVNRNAYDFRYGPGFAGYATNLYATPRVALPSSTLVGGNLADPFAVSRTRLGSLYASDTVGLWDGRILITGGLRYQKMDLRSYSYADGSQASRYREDAVTPVAGIVFKPAAGISLFANRIESLAQGPTAPLTALDPSSGTTKPVANAGEVFDPYTSVQYEVGGKFAFGGVAASVALYTTSKPAGQVQTDAANPALVRFGLYGEQRNRGIELSLDGEVAHGLRLIAGASITDAELRKTPGGVNAGNKAPGVPDYSFNANAEWDLPFAPALTLTGRVVHTGEQMVNAANTLELPSWTRFDLGARYVAVVSGRAVTLRANVDNVANERYWASAFDAFGQALLQGTPRTYKASVSVDF